MRIHLLTDHPVLEQAAHLLARYYNDYRFLEKVRTVSRFNYTSHNGRDVAIALKNANIDIYVKTYRPWNPWTKAIGHATYDRKAKVGIIHCNVYKLDLPLLKRVNNFMHEPLHMLGYGHKGNTKNEFNLGTVPYKVGQMFEDFVKKELGQ